MGTYNQPYVPTADILWADNLAAVFGTGSDAKIYYDGTDLFVDPQVVGAGSFKILYAGWVLKTVGATPAEGFMISNTTAAALDAQQYSPALRFHGSGRKTDAVAASQEADWRIYEVPVQGAAVITSYLSFDSSINGGAFANKMQLSSNGLLTLGAPVTHNLLLTAMVSGGYGLSFVAAGGGTAQIATNNTGTGIVWANSHWRPYDATENYDLGIPGARWKDLNVWQSANIGIAGSKQGTLTLSGVTSGTVTVAVAAAAGIWTLTLPDTKAELFRVASTQLTNAQVVALRATPITLVAAPGDNKAIVVHKIYLVCDSAAAAYTEPDTNNLVVEYASGLDITGAIEATGFVTAGAVAARTYGVLDTELTPPANSAVRLFQTGAAEFGGGNVANTLSVRVWYSVVDTVAFT